MKLRSAVQFVAVWTALLEQRITFATGVKTLSSPSSEKFMTLTRSTTPSSSTSSSASASASAASASASVAANARGGGTSSSSSDTGDARYDGGYDGAPWQETSASNLQSILEASRYERLPPIVFSPTGRLHLVEAAVQASKAVTPRSNVLIAMHCRDGMVVISTVPTSPFLNTTTVAAVTNTTTTEKVSATTTADTALSEGSVTDVTSNNHSNTDNNHQTQSSLFLFEETCSVPSTCPIIDIYPGLVAGTGGNAVDGHLLRRLLLAFGEAALENQQTITGSFHTGGGRDGQGHDLAASNVRASVVAKQLANKLQEATQKMGGESLGLLASSSVVLGNRQIWRIDPTGQFWQCDATVVGRDADKTEEELYQRLLERSSNHGPESSSNRTTTTSTMNHTEKDVGGRIRTYLETLAPDDALDLVRECLQARLMASFPQQQSTVTSSIAARPAAAAATSSPVFWQAIIVDYSSSAIMPKRIFRRGTFIVPRKVT